MEPLDPSSLGRFPDGEPVPQFCNSLAVPTDHARSGSVEVKCGALLPGTADRLRVAQGRGCGRLWFRHTPQGLFSASRPG